MKPTKVRNQQIYRASYNTRSKQLGSTLSKELRKKYGKRSMRVIKGDTVKIMRGEYKDVDGKVSKVSPIKNSVAIEGIKKEKSRGEKFDIYIQTSNLMITTLNTDDHWRKSKLQGKSPKTTPKETTKKQSEDNKKEKKSITKEIKSNKKENND